MKTYQQFKTELFKDKKVKQAYNSLALEYELTAKLIEKRLEKGMTQQELARKIGTKQSAISRLESGSYNPSLAFLNRVARGLDAKLGFVFY